MGKISLKDMEKNINKNFQLVYNLHNPPHKEVLKYKYLNEGLSRSQLAKFYGVSKTVINIWLRDFQIYKKLKPSKIEIIKNFFKKLFL